MNPDYEEIKYLQSQVRALEKKLRDLFYDVESIMYLAQSEHSPSESVCAELKKLCDDSTRWTI
jgi:hypothetical protein